MANATVPDLESNTDEPREAKRLSILKAAAAGRGASRSGARRPR